MNRLLIVSNKLELDIICRVTADNPFTANELFQELLDEHFSNGYDHSSLKDAPIGISPRIMTVEALNRAKPQKKPQTTSRQRTSSRSCFNLFRCAEQTPHSMKKNNRFFSKNVS